jgi:putative transposase
MVSRVERHLIKKSNPMWKTIDYYCWQAKNVYNAANYIIRQELINNRKWIRNYDLQKIMQSYDCFYDLGSQASQNTLTLLDRNWKSFFVAIKDWSKKKGVGYLGKPSLPKYLDKNGRYILMLKNIQFRIMENKIYFSWKPLNQFSGIKTNVTGKLMQIRFVPAGACYYMEIVYETEVPEKQEIRNIIGIDLGVDNFATISNNIGVRPIIINGKTIKSMNQYFNKKKAELQTKSGFLFTNKIRSLTNKHRDKLDYFMHKTSRIIIDYCLTYGIDTVIIGKNDGWKQEVNIGKRNNQNFVYIPYEKFITKLEYKCENYGINFIETEESYTSGTSFLDDELPIKENYNKKRRIKRGLFKSNSGELINADLNGSYQIIKKVFPNAFEQGTRGCGLHPIRISF